jgi:chromosome segregation ATPase
MWSHSAGTESPHHPSTSLHMPNAGVFTPRGAATTAPASGNTSGYLDEPSDVDAAAVAAAAGGNPNAVQMGIMKGRLQGLQHELQTSKRDMKDMSDRLTVTTTKLNEQKVQNSALTHKYSSLMTKLSETEQAEKQLEETLVNERRNAASIREAADRYRQEVQDQEETIAQLKHQLSAKPIVDPSIAIAIRDRNQYLPTREVVERQQIVVREKETLLEQMTTALDRLVLGQEEDETTLFVCRSAVLSAATDLETKLAHTENVVDNLNKLFQQYAHEQEEETTRMMMSLMNENKELWTHVTKMRYDLDRSNSELAARNKRQAEWIPKDQHEYTLKQVSLLEERLKKAQQTIEAQTTTEQTVEEKIRDLIQQLNSSKMHCDALEADLDQSQSTLRERELELDTLHAIVKQKSQEVIELDTLQQHQAAQIRSLTEQIDVLQETFETEGRLQLRRAQSERDEALDALTRLRSDFEDALHRLATIEKELDQRTSYFNSYKVSIEEQHGSYARTLQEELAHNRSLFERELEDLRRELADRTSELHAVTRELDEERADRQGTKAALRTSDEETVRLRSEVNSLQASLGRSEDRIKKLSSELDAVRQQLSQNDHKRNSHQQEVQRLEANVAHLEELLVEERQRHAAHATAIEADWKESDKSRHSLHEEVKRLRTRVSESDQLRSLKERMEKDKEQLMSENVRLHQQYQEVQQQNIDLQQTITTLKSRSSSSSALTSQMEELQRRLSELPSLRQAVDEARREAMRFKEEMESLRHERDEMSTRLEFFLEESRLAAKKDNDLDRLFRDATSQVRRLDQQLEEVQRSATRRGVTFGERTGSPNSARRSPVRPWRN